MNFGYGNVTKVDQNHVINGTGKYDFLRMCLKVPEIIIIGTIAGGGRGFYSLIFYILLRRDDVNIFKIFCVQNYLYAIPPEIFSNRYEFRAELNGFISVIVNLS